MVLFRYPLFCSRRPSSLGDRFPSKNPRNLNAFRALEMLDEGMEEDLMRIMLYAKLWQQPPPGADNSFYNPNLPVSYADLNSTHRITQFSEYYMRGRNPPKLLWRNNTKVLYGDFPLGYFPLSLLDLFELLRQRG